MYNYHRMNFHVCHRILELHILLLIYFSKGVHSAIQLPHATAQCLDQTVEYQCIVRGSGFFGLQWSVFRDDGTQLGIDVTYISTTIDASDTIGGLFTVEQLSDTPLVSNVSFIAVSSIDRYTVVCEDTITMSNVTILINIAGIPATPQNLTIHTDTFTSSSVNISWTESSSDCVTGYRYNVSSTATKIVQSTSDPTVTTVTVEGLVPSDDQYCVVVTAINNRSSSDSDTVCFYYNVPPQLVITGISNEQESATTDSIILQWTFGLSDDIAVPDSTFTLTLSNMDDDGSSFYKISGAQPHGTGYTFTFVPKGRNYTIELVATNNIGSTALTTYFQGRYVTVTTDTTYSSTNPPSVLSATTVNTARSISPSCSNEAAVGGSNGLSSSASVGITFVFTVPVTAIITAIITIIIMYLLCIKHIKQSGVLPPSDYETPVQSSSTGPSTHSGPEIIKSNTAYGQMNYTPDNPTPGDMYETMIA